MKTTLLIVLLTLTFFCTKAQDTLNIMSYNILNYPVSNATKADTLRAIIQYTKPDIFMVTELVTSTGATTILNNALNVAGVTYYNKATFFDGPDTDNMLYYNSNKLQLFSQHQIATTLRDISEYVLYYKDPNIATATDTVFIHCYMAHLKASQGASNEQKRNQEAVLLKNYLDSKANVENVFLGGDFNFYGDYEAAYNTIINGGNVPLFDPIASPGSWHINASFAGIQTQSTRSSSLPDGGSFGGVDDRFDFIFVSNDVLTGSKKLKYISNTYRAVGNDGNHFNKSINASPTNTSVPSNVLSALYYMSDHMPIFLKAYVNLSVGINENTIANNWKGYLFQNNFMFSSSKQEQTIHVTVYNVLGKVVLNKTYENTKAFKLNLEKLKPNLYFVKINTDKQQKSFKVVNQ